MIYTGYLSQVITGSMEVEELKISDCVEYDASGSRRSLQKYLRKGDVSPDYILSLATRYARCFLILQRDRCLIVLFLISIQIDMLSRRST
jgi:hypothetical protein